MKSVLQEKEIQHRLELKRFARRLNSQEKKLLRNRPSRRKEDPSDKKPSASRFAKGVVPGVGKGFSERLVLEVPKMLDLVSNYEETAEFVRDMRLAALRNHRNVFLDFDNTERIHPTALLLLLAETHRCRLLHGHERVVGTYPKNPALERLFVRTGFFNLLGVKSKTEVKPLSYPVEYIPFQSNNRLDTSMPRKIREELLGDKVVMHPKARSRLFRAITEAMINVGQHAYPAYSLKAHPVKGRWWMAGHVNKSKNELMFTFCDLGVGIPETLPKIYTWERIRFALSLLPGVKPNDGEMIQAGMTLGRSRTREEHRGRGLNDLRSFIDIAGAGELYIFSRKGRYRYSVGGEEKVFNSEISMSGTLIKWSVPLAHVTDWIEDDEIVD
ncbi:MAG: hypothetical protein EPO47_11245 [Rugosibacter sp.]|nr:MAG: hypothetical protein EPO47_11245 [Rugosibacter sp.]